MITLAFDTATDRCTVAAADGPRQAHRVVDGARRHAGAILGAVGDVLRELGVTVHDVRRVLTADGPGSFTGLRVATAVAKGLVWRREIEWRVAPSLLVRAAGHAPAGGGTVLAVSDALRGELYAGCWRFDAGTAVERVGPSPRALRPHDLREFGAVDVVVGSIPAPLLSTVESATGRRPVVGDLALPDARMLLRLTELAGGTDPVIDPVGWEPDYGRPAEAQAVWERTHGQPLPTPSGVFR